VGTATELNGTDERRTAQTGPLPSGADRVVAGHRLA
jgi:hypothetical protein